MHMHAGLHICTFDWNGGTMAVPLTLADTVRDAEAAGFNYVTMMDHFIQAEGFMPPTDPIIEGYAALSFVAAHTERVTLGMLVTGVMFRNPAVLAKTVTTLDVLSGGRAMLGLGAAWYEREHRALGIRYPGAPERLERLEEAIQICLQTWSDDDGPFDGVYHTLTETMTSPPALTRPHPPILIGGGGERRTLQLVARYADIWNIGSFPTEVIRRKLGVLREHCDVAGRDFARIRKTVLWMTNALEEPDAFRYTLDEYAELGFDTVFVMPYGSEPRSAVADLAALLHLS
jgi:F420-dependent oxidoreductase-like protein